MLLLQVEAPESGSYSRGHCIEVCNDCAPIIQDCHITSKNSSKCVLINALPNVSIVIFSTKG